MSLVKKDSWIRFSNRKKKTTVYSSGAISMTQPNSLQLELKSSSGVRSVKIESNCPMSPYVMRDARPNFEESARR